MYNNSCLLRSSTAATGARSDLHCCLLSPFSKSVFNSRVWVLPHTQTATSSGTRRCAAPSARRAVQHAKHQQASSSNPTTARTQEYEKGLVTLALKEWAVTCAALGSGDQTILVRKGGLRDPTFRPAASRFLLFPTSFHTTAALVKADAAEKHAKALQEEPKHQARLVLPYAAHLTGAWTTMDARLLEVLNEQHIWSPEFLEARLRWRPKQPLTLMEVRVWRLQPPLRLQPQDDYWGCFSWVQLGSGVEPAAWDAAEPVVSDEDFDGRQQALRERLASLGGVHELSF